MKIRIYARRGTALRFLQTVEVVSLDTLFSFLPRLAGKLSQGERFRTRIVGY
jgi:hypothetical protein